MEIFTPLAPEMLADPYPIYSRLRETDPVHWHDQLQAYVLTRYADCDRVLREPEVFVSDFRRIGEDPPPAFLSLQTLDPPDHTAVRRIVLKAMRAMDLDEWLAKTCEVAENRLAVLGDEFDFVADFAEPVAANSMCLLFGVPLLEDEAGFRAAQRDLVLSMDAGLEPERGPIGMDARGRLSGLIEPWVDHPPPTGLLSKVDFAEAGDRLPFLINSLRAIFVAGYSSTGSMLGNGVLALLDHGYFAGGDTPPPPDMTMFHELIRLVGPVQAESRAVVSDVEVGGTTLPRGSIVVIVLGSANRDPEVFDAPDVLRLDREPNNHLGFGRGIHSCVGGRLALGLLRDVLGPVTQRFRIEAAGTAVRRPTATLRGLDALPVRLRPRATYGKPSNPAVDPWPRVPVLATVSATARLSPTFSPERLRDAVAVLRTRQWLQPRIYSGEGLGPAVTDLDWRSLPLRSIGGDPERTDPGGPALQDFQDTPWLDKVPYLRSVLDALPAPKRAVRLMALGPGATSPTHSDTKYGFPWGTVRLHVPIVTAPEAVLVIDDAEHCWQPGELWYADFTRPHLVRNTGDTTRIHMVIDCQPTPALLDLFPAEFGTDEVRRNTVYAGPEQAPQAGDPAGYRCGFDCPRTFTSFEEEDDAFRTAERVPAEVDVLDGALTLILDGEPAVRLEPAGHGEFRFAGWTNERTIEIRRGADDGGDEVILRVRAGERLRTLTLPARRVAGRPA